MSTSETVSLIAGVLVVITGIIGGLYIKPKKDTENDKTPVTFSDFIQKHCDYVHSDKHDCHTWETDLAEYPNLYTTEQLHEVFHAITNKANKI